MIQLFKLAKTSAIESRSPAINPLKAVLVGTDPQLRESLSGLSNPKLIRRCVDLDLTTPTDPTSAAEYTLRLLARRMTSVKVPRAGCDQPRITLFREDRHSLPFLPFTRRRRGGGRKGCNAHHR